MVPDVAHYRPLPNPAPAGLGAAAKFNPQLWKPEELRAIFVVRQTELGELLRRVRQAKADCAPQHVLITGHRGMGKSTLLHRLALAIDDDAALRQAWVPLLFREEQYTAVTLDKFWRNALDALSEALERRAGCQPDLQADIRSLDAINAALDQQPSAAKREELALATLCEWAARHKARFVLLVDSTEQLFAGLGHGKTRGDQPLWRLRERLSHDATFFWISCAYAALESHQPYDHPFHEFFAQMPLQPLTSADMRLAFMALARTFGAGRGLPADQAEAHAQALLKQQPERLETLLRLAGGNPRTTVLLYQLLAAGGYDSVHSDLQRLLDDVSPLYKDRLENQLAIQPRQVVATIMEHWAPMSAKAVAQATAMPVTQINAQLSRLEAGGWIEKVRLPGSRRSGYQVSERFFNVWYLMRLAPRRLRLRLTWLVEFMRVWFSDAERTQLASRRAVDHRQGQWCDDRQLEFSRALSLSLDETAPERAQLDLALYSRTIRGRVGEVVIFDTDGEDQPFASIDDYRARFAQLRPALQKVPFDAEQQFDKAAFINGVLSSLTLSLQQKEHVAATAATLSRVQCDRLMAVFSNERARWRQFCLDAEDLEALLARVASADFFPDAPDLSLALMQARAWFHDRPAVHALLLTMIHQRHRDAARQIADELPATGPGVVRRARLMNGIAVLQMRAGKYLAAAEAYRQAIAMDPQDAAPWNNLGYLLERHLYRFDDAEAAYRQAIAIDPKHAQPWIGLGNLLENHLRRFDEAEAAYRQAIAIDAKHAQPWIGLGNLLQNHLRRFDEAEAAYRQAIAIDPKHPLPWNNLGNLLQDHLRRFDEAEAAYRQAITIDPAGAYPAANLARLMAQAARQAEAAEAYQRVLGLPAVIAADNGQRFANLTLQAHLFLGQQAAAAQALAHLTATLDNTLRSAHAMRLIEEQAFECQGIGLGLRLADLLELDGRAELLKPIELALRLANGQAERLWDQPAELQAMAREIAQGWPAPVAEPRTSTTT